LTQFEVRVMNKGAISSMALDAPDEESAAQAMRSRGYTLLSVSQAVTRAPQRDAFGLMLFTRELLALLNAGIGVVEALEVLAERQSSASSRDVLLGVLGEVRTGKTLSSAMRPYPRAFPVLYVETIRAAERTGALAESLTRYCEYQARVDQVKQALVSAMLYPALLAGVGILVSLFLLGYVVPRFSGIYEDMGGDVPLASRMLFALGATLDRNAFAAGMAATGILIGAALAARSEAVRSALGGALARAPWLGARLRTYRLARLYRTAAMLLRGGVPLATALDTVSGLLDASSREALAAATREVREGSTLSAALERHHLTTPIATRMLRVGERGGDLSGLMSQAAAFHEEELARFVERFTRLFEPLLMLVIGLMIGAIVVLMYMPIFDLAGSLR
jgi:general secretion pathway protein F